MTFQDGKIVALDWKKNEQLWKNSLNISLNSREPLKLSVSELQE